MTVVENIEICLIGAGPRGLSVLERICANHGMSATARTLTVHVVDDAAPGAGSVWRADQSPHLLTNTVACQITVFPDSSSRIDGPIVPGPSLHDWAVQISAGRPEVDEDPQTVREAIALGPNCYPTRAFYGRYLNASFRRIVGTAPGTVTVVVHRSRAVALADTHGRTDGPQGVRLADGTRLHGLDAVVLAQGHLPTRPTPAESRAASLARIHGLAYVAPANPADVDLRMVEPGEPVLLRGLGLSFFDYMAMLTLGRGGEFTSSDGKLTYRRSGHEPIIHATSRRGVPYHARGENEKGTSGRYEPRRLTPDLAVKLRACGATGAPLDFATVLWPLIRKEVEGVYYSTRLGCDADGVRCEEFLTEFHRSTSEDDEYGVLDAYGLADRRWDWSSIVDPVRNQVFRDPAEFRTWILDYLSRDVAASRAGNVSGPVKAALDVLRDIRNEIRLAVDHGGLEGRSHQIDLYGWYTPMNAFLSIGPPVHRIEQMIALIEAGVLHLIGPHAVISVDTVESEFVASSLHVPGSAVRARALIEARLPEPDIRRTADPLLIHMLETGQCAPYRISGENGTVYETGGLSVTERPNRVIDAQGFAHPRRFAYGIPTESVYWATAVGIRPGVDSVTIAEADSIASAVLALDPAGTAGAATAADHASLAEIAL